MMMMMQKLRVTLYPTPSSALTRDIDDNEGLLTLDHPKLAEGIIIGIFYAASSHQMVASGHGHSSVGLSAGSSQPCIALYCASNAPGRKLEAKLAAYLPLSPSYDIT